MLLSSSIRALINLVPKHGFLYRNFCSQELPKAFVRCVDSEVNLSLTLVYANPNYRIKERQFTFNRVQIEPLEISTSRISEKIKVKAPKTKKTITENGLVQFEVQDVKIDVQVLIGGIPCSGDKLCKDSLINGAQLKIGESLYDIAVNVPTVQTLVLPKNIMAGFLVHPKVEIEFAKMENCEFNWYRSTSDKVPTVGAARTSAKLVVPLLHANQDWQHVGTGFCYQTSPDDVGRRVGVTCTPKSANGEPGPVTEAVSAVAVNAGPGHCPFDTRHEMTKSLTGPGRYVSYNILSDHYADSDINRATLYGYCPRYALTLDYRKQLFLKEILGYNADIVCLQEVDKHVFENDLNPVMVARGFTGVFGIKEGQLMDGLACFFRNSKFRLVDHHNAILADITQSNPQFKDILETVNRNEKLKERFLRRTTALQVVVLESEEVPKQFLCIGNTHLYFHADADHVRLLQAGAVLLHLGQVVSSTKSKNSTSDVALALSGNFNSSPPSGVFQLMTTQNVPEDHADWSSNEFEAVKDFSLNHPFHLESACGTTPYTHFTTSFAGCLDYIFVDSDQIAVERVIPLPTEAEMKEHTALPSITLPSDHVALACDLSWKKAKQ